MRKLSPDRQHKLDRMHLRDCPLQDRLEYACLRCREIRARQTEESAKP